MKRFILAVLLFLVPLTASAANWISLGVSTNGNGLAIDVDSLKYEDGIMMATFNLGGQIAGAGLTVSECRNDTQILYVDFKPRDKNYPVKEVWVSKTGVRMYETAARALCKAGQSYV